MMSDAVSCAILQDAIQRIWSQPKRLEVMMRPKTKQLVDREILTSDECARWHTWVEQVARIVARVIRLEARSSDVVRGAVEGEERRVAVDTRLPAVRRVVVVAFAAQVEVERVQKLRRWQWRQRRG